MRLLTRLNRLEQATRRTAPTKRCADCGGPVHWKNWRPEPGECSITLTPHGEAPAVPDVCPGCARPLVIRVEFDRGGTARVEVLALLCGLAAIVMGAALWA